MTSYYISCTYATGLVTINEEGIILDTCPIWKRYIGEPIEYFIKNLKEIKVVKLGDGNERQKTN